MSLIVSMHSCGRSGCTPTCCLHTLNSGCPQHVFPPSLKLQAVLLSQRYKSKHNKAFMWQSRRLFGRHHLRVYAKKEAVALALLAGAVCFSSLRSWYFENVSHRMAVNITEVLLLSMFLDVFGRFVKACRVLTLRCSYCNTQPQHDKTDAFFLVQTMNSGI